MSKIQSIRQGGSLPFVFDRGGEDTTGWVCTITVKQFPADSASISRVIESSTDSDTGDSVWSGYLTSTETAALAVGHWNLNASLVNADNDEEEAVPVRFQIATTWA